MKTITWHGVLQAIAALVQLLNLVYTLPSLPGNYKPLVAVAIGFGQVILHQYALNQPPPVVPPVQ